jgi:hypothetical protein
LPTINLNAGYVPTTYLNPNAIPGQPGNTYADPTGPNPALGGPVSVDTASLAAFGQYVANELHEPLSQLIPQLQSVQVEPGAFYYADYIRTHVNGTSPSTGLANQFVQVITHLLDGLIGIQQGVTTLGQKYKSVEDLNQAAASDLATDFGTASSYFNLLTGDSQGPPSSGGSGK